ncbi:type II toxin-antitoxin system RelB/DinJ family antitoxin [Schaalia sp. Marseille-Q2122]|uniref:type II toxin-antitoxin system RelB/DinJ family antitoxin n=1 Tax=Schaalia sp. Marseille-Q2122 TaxID=2736604 RepID=UPI001588311C|nr:type II toxin-antitoxin system RelB/DinJ family antitoxin [Schaalia sp. Marseille-Q2122]
MAKTATIFARVEPEVKESAENILDQLGVPMSNAVDMFLRQVIQHQGLPFSLNLVPQGIIDLRQASEVALHAEIQRGLEDSEAGRGLPAAEVRESFKNRSQA